MEQHHYLGYEQPVGEHLKYLVFARGRPVACLAWTSAPRHLGSRDRFIGWKAERGRRTSPACVQHAIFDFAVGAVPHLASNILGRMTRQLSAEWERMYAHPIYFVETFIDPSGFAAPATGPPTGCCWGRRRVAARMITHKANRSIKEVLGFPLTPRFRELFRE